MPRKRLGDYWWFMNLCRHEAETIDEVPEALFGARFPTALVHATTLRSVWGHVPMPLAGALRV